MITLFRRIREKLIASGSFTKYLLYAIGEILLVVIGILIALQVNNWNSEQRDRNISIEYHNRLIAEIDQRIKGIESEIERAGEISQGLSQAVEVLEKREINDSTKAILDYALSRYNQLAPFSFQLVSYEEMKSSGRLSLIYDIDLRQELNGYFDRAIIVSNIISQLNKDVNGSNQLFDKYVRVYINEERSGRSIDYDALAISKDPLLINTLSRFAYVWDTYQYFLRNIIERMEQLQVAIQLELDSF
ncbi:hypothetical protein AB2B38_008195 [Balneola sp. MJW-20]|uniref:hypothetical protein n=1 Tax=Gracilimonas aurantiaca TaxID=3234185 RepID=UPI003467952A